MAKAAVKKTRKKAAGGVNKSQQARDYKAKNPAATTQEIADTIGSSYNGVYQALKGGKKTKKAKRGRPKGSSNGHTKSTSGAMSSFEHFFSAVADVGLTKAREFLDRLEKMRK